MRVIPLLAAVVAGLLAAAHSVASQDLGRGKLIFESQCSRCHGITGGGAMGPSLRRPTFRSAPDDSAFALLLANGLYERGMPPAWQLGPAETSDLIAYVRTMGRASGTRLAGDSARGRAIYDGKGACGTCHMVDGVGGAFGPDLTMIGVMRGAEYLREATVNPAAVLPMGPQTNYPPGQYARYLPVRAVTSDGTEVFGVRVNEDRFTIQIRTPDGELHSVRKLTLTALDKRFGESLMPTYAGVFSPRELDDLVAYMASLREASRGPRSSRPIP